MRIAIAVPVSSLDHQTGELCKSRIFKICMFEHVTLLHRINQRLLRIQARDCVHPSDFLVEGGSITLAFLHTAVRVAGLGAPSTPQCDGGEI